MVCATSCNAARSCANACHFASGRLGRLASLALGDAALASHSVTNQASCCARTSGTRTVWLAAKAVNRRLRRPCGRDHRIRRYISPPNAGHRSGGPRHLPAAAPAICRQLTVTGTESDSIPTLIKPPAPRPATGLCALLPWWRHDDSKKALTSQAPQVKCHKSSATSPVPQV